MSRRPSAKHECEECGASYKHPMRRGADGPDSWRKSNSKVCPECRSAKAREARKAETSTDRPVMDHTCKNCGVVYPHPMSKTSWGGGWQPSKSTLCPDCRLKQRRESWEKNRLGQGGNLQFPASLPSRPCKHCGKQHDRRRSNGLFYSSCLECNYKAKAEADRLKLEREVNRRVRAEVQKFKIDYHRNKVARLVMEELVEVMRYVAPNHDALSTAEGLLLEWRP